MIRLFRLPPLLLLAVLASGCAEHYVTPAGGLSMAEFATEQVTDVDLRAYYQAQPASAFPAHLAIIRVQDAGYTTKTNHGYGQGRYTVVTTRDIETDAAMEKFQSLPMVQAVAPVGRLLVPSNAHTIKDLQTPAARLHADILLIYSVDTTFSVDGKSFGPMSFITLGFLPNMKARVTATVAGVLVDVRTGYVYGTTETTTIEEHRASFWSTEMVVDAARLAAEEAAFADFANEFRDLWTGVIESHVRIAPGSPAHRSQRRNYYYVNLEQ